MILWTRTGYCCGISSSLLLLRLLGLRLLFCLLGLCLLLLLFS
jgi:hypothetical protein